jgi:hypothetical protein
MPIVRELDFTSSLPSGCTFSRVGSRNAIQSGLVASVAENVPAFESTDTVDLGLSIQGASSNQVTTLDYTTFNMSNMSVTAVSNSLTGGSDAWDLAAVGTGTSFRKFEYKKSGLTAGTRFCLSVYVSEIPSSIKRLFGLVLTSEFNNSGSTALFRNDNIEGVSENLDLSLYNDVESGFERVNDDWFRVWISGVKLASGTGAFALRSINFTTAQVSSPGDPLHRVKIYGFQVETGVRRPSSYMGLGTVSQDILQITDVTGFTGSEGTIVIEHDARNGDLLQESASAIITAEKPGKVALAWSGSTSSRCVNGEAVTTDGAVSISGTLDVMPNAVGHIKSITVYDERLSDSDLRIVTRKDGNPKSGEYRVCTTQNRLPTVIYTPTASYRNIVRYPFKVTHDVSAAKLVFNNWAATASGDQDGSEMTVHRCALEYGGSFYPVTFSSAEGITIAAGASDISSDDIGALPAGTEGFIRVEVSATDQTVSRWTFEDNATAYFYNPALSSISDVYATGDLSILSGGASVEQPAKSYCPIMVGISSDAEYDPPAIFSCGDSIQEGTGALNNEGTFAVKACATQNFPLLLHAVGGQSHIERDASVKWQDSLKYTRILVDNFYANSSAAIQGAVHSIYKAANDADIERIYRVETFPRSTSTDNWNSNQTVTTANTKPNLGDKIVSSWIDQAYVDPVIPCTGIYNGTDTGWVLNGTDFYMTVDGLHQSVVADDIVAANMSTFLSDVTLNQPEPQGVEFIQAVSTVSVSTSVQSFSINSYEVVQSVAGVSINTPSHSFVISEPAIEFTQELTEVLTLSPAHSLSFGLPPIEFDQSLTEISASAPRHSLVIGDAVRVSTFTVTWA